MARPTERATKAREMHAAGQSNQDIKDSLGYKSIGAVYAVVNDYTSPNRANGGGGTGGSRENLLRRAHAKFDRATSLRAQASKLEDEAADLEKQAETADQREQEKAEKKAHQAAAKREKITIARAKVEKRLEELKAQIEKLEAATNGE